MPDDYDVGYGKTPKHTRFKKGQSGNPKGRPKGSKNLKTIIDETLSTRVPVTLDGKKRTMPLREALIHKLAADSFNGSVRDKIAFMSFVDQHSPIESSWRDPSPPILVEYVLPEGKTVEDYERERREQDEKWGCKTTAEDINDGDPDTDTENTRKD